MATNLLIGDAGLVLDGATASISNTASTTYPLTNLFGGNKTDRFELATAASGDTRITIDAGSAVPASYLYLAGCRMLQKNSVGTITVKANSSNNYGTATTVATISSFGSATLRGPHADDYVATFTQASYRYWFVNYNASSASKIPHAKMFLGAAFDPGRDPNQPVVVSRVRPTGGRRKAIYTYEFSWQGLAYDKAVEMYERFFRPRRYSPVVLMTTDYHAILMGARVLFGRVISMKLPPRVTGLNDVSMVVEEMI